jgi:hypothetical protein
VISANHHERVERAHALDHRIRLSAVPDKVAEHDHAIPGVYGSRRKDGLERVDVRVNVGEDQIPHGI